MPPRSLLACATLLLGAIRPAAAGLPAENYVLAISWEPAFCLQHADKAECRNETPGRQDAHAFSLHGLWPQNASYCGVTPAQKAADAAGQWDQLPPVTLQPDTEAALQVVQPGTQSHLERHEWIEHGTCSGLSQQDFFAPAIALLGSVNQGPLGRAVAGAVGGKLALAQLQAAAAQGNGKGAAGAFEFLCVRSGGQQWLQEVRVHLHLPAALATAVDANDLARAGRVAAPSQRCRATTPIGIRAVAASAAQ